MDLALPLVRWPCSIPAPVLPPSRPTTTRRCGVWTEQPSAIWWCAVQRRSSRRGTGEQGCRPGVGQIRLGRVVFQKFYGKAGPWVSHVAIGTCQESCKFLNSCDIFATLTQDQICSLAEVLEEEEFDDDEAIVEQGEKDDKMFILRAGQAVACIAGEKGEIEVKQYSLSIA